MRRALLTALVAGHRFWRGDRARDRSRDGAGLGLARGLVERHGGTIWAEERASGGARVAFTLPPASTRGAEG